MLAFSQRKDSLFQSEKAFLSYFLEGKYTITKSHIENNINEIIKIIKFLLNK